MQCHLMAGICMASEYKLEKKEVQRHMIMGLHLQQLYTKRSVTSARNSPMMTSLANLTLRRISQDSGKKNAKSLSASRSCLMAQTGNIPLFFVALVAVGSKVPMDGSHTFQKTGTTK